jgi:hypothetical protein
MPDSWEESFLDFSGVEGWVDNDPLLATDTPPEYDDKRVRFPGILNTGKRERHSMPQGPHGRINKEEPSNVGWT